MLASKHRLEPIPVGSLQAVGPGINRPETTLGTRSAQIYSSTDDAAVAIVNAAGAVSRVGKSVCSNGIAMDLQGRILIANFSLDTDRPGPLQRLDLASGEVEDLVTEIDGRRLVASNFVVVARDGTIYCTHSSWGPSVASCVKPHIADGFVYRVSPDGAVSVVATGLAGANGCCLDAEQRYLYVAQTGRGRIVRFLRNADGSLGQAEPYGPQLGDIPLVESADDLFALPPEQKSRLGHPDNIAFDADGNLWIALPVANKIVAITPAGELVTVIDDPECTKVIAPTSIAWGGPDLMDVYIGSLGTPHVLMARSPVPGMPLCHQA
ncbi:MAG: SMP-30/gluconolactonase/LRE family protein [Alphaproteobacteria bacterium]|nr:SMP-30/gluconolactonase/LRE family protein [Alphaproteobacteria bacterium]